MDRVAWLKAQRRRAEEQENTIYAPIYDERWGIIAPTHQQWFDRFLGLCPPQGHILDAACGTGKYWPLLLASAKFPAVPSAKVGLQELPYRDAFDGVVCIDALEMVCPEDWPGVLSNLYRALKPTGYIYFTVEIATEQELEKALADGQRAGLPVWSMANGRRKAGITMYGRRRGFIITTRQRACQRVGTTGAISPH